MGPLNIGTFSSDYYAIKSVSEAGFYHALIEAQSSKYNPYGHFDEVWFYAGDSYVEFMIYYIPREIEYPSSVRISVSKKILNLENYLNMENYTVYVPAQKFIELFILKPHPATDWLLFNQGIWNNA
jgi:hypothetical protein